MGQLGIDCDGDTDLRNETVCNAVGERYEGHDYKRRQYITNIVPVDLCNLTNHHTADLSLIISHKLSLYTTFGLTMINVQPVAHGGSEAKIGAKKMETKKHNPETMAVIPVRPPSAMPAPLSMNAVTGEDPNKAPMEMKKASVQYARVERRKSPSLRSSMPQKRTMEYNVAVASMIST